MKDTVITAAAKRRELKIWLACFIVAFVVNVAAIIYFVTPWYEIFTQLGYVVVLSVSFYVLTVAARLIWFGIRRITSAEAKN